MKPPRAICWERVPDVGRWERRSPGASDRWWAIGELQRWEGGEHYVGRADGPDGAITSEVVLVRHQQSPARSGPFASWPGSVWLDCRDFSDFGYSAHPPVLEFAAEYNATQRSRSDRRRWLEATRVTVESHEPITARAMQALRLGALIQWGASALHHLSELSQGGDEGAATALTQATRRADDAATRRDRELVLVQLGERLAGIEREALREALVEAGYDAAAVKALARALTRAADGRQLTRLGATAELLRHEGWPCSARQVSKLRARAAAEGLIPTRGRGRIEGS